LHFYSAINKAIILQNNTEHMKIKTFVFVFFMVVVAVIVTYDPFFTEFRIITSLMISGQGYADAQLTIGDMYRDGKRLSQNNSEAMKWYRKAADQGLAEAQSKLGSMYYT
jgi:TPR repeat protein